MKRVSLLGRSAPAVLLLCLGAAQVVIVLTAEGALRVQLSNLCQTFSAGLAAWACLRGARRLRGEHDPAASAWALIAIAITLWAAGTAAYTAFSFAGAPRYPGVPDVFYFAFFPVMIAGVWSLPGRNLSRGERWNCLLDVGALTAIALMVVWQFSLRSLVTALATQPAASNFASAAYTVCDTVLLVLIFWRLVQKLGAGRQFLPVLLLTIGGLVLIPSDLLLSSNWESGLFNSNVLADFGWTIFTTFCGFAGLALATPSRIGGGSGFQDTGRAVWPIAITYLWITCALLVLVKEVVDHRQAPGGMLFFGVCAALAMAITRQIRSVRETVRLNRTLQESHAALESKVAERTAEIQRQAELLRASEHKFRTLFDTAYDAIFLLESGTIRACNHKTAEMFAVEPVRLIGQSPLEFSPLIQPDGRSSTDSARSRLQGAIAGRPQRFEWRHRRPDGSEFDAEVSLNRVQIDGSTFVQAIVRDVTDRKQAEAALQKTAADLEQERRFFEGLFEGLPGNAFVIAADGRVVRANRNALAFYGDEILDASISDLAVRLPSQHARRLIDAIPAALAKGQAAFEYVTTRADGRQVPMSVQATTITLGGTRYIVAMGFDISDRLEAERALIQAQKMEAVGQLAGGVAHDFNNILTAILIQLSLLGQDPSVGVAVRDGLSELEAEAKRAANLTRQLLMFSRRQALQRQSLDCNALIANLLKMLRRLIGEQIALELQAAPGELWLEADPGMLEQVVVNLVVNARDAISGAGRITIRTELTDVDASAAQQNREAYTGRFVRLTVSDTGSGIDAATLPHIFEPFFTTKEAGKGTGLGLATAFGIVKQHLGWIELSTTVGKGTSFAIYLPAQAPATATANSARGEQALRPGSEQILVVEDEAAVRRILVEMLTKLGYQVYSAASGPEALRLWDEHQRDIQLVISDVVMPGGISGIQLATALRQHASPPKIILMSGYSPDEILSELPSLGDVRFLKKPFEATALADAVRDALERR